jgi:hypothetical protein
MRTRTSPGHTVAVGTVGINRAELSMEKSRLQYKFQKNITHTQEDQSMNVKIQTYKYGSNTQSITVTITNLHVQNIYVTIQTNTYVD